MNNYTPDDFDKMFYDGRSNIYFENQFFEDDYFKRENDTPSKFRADYSFEEKNSLLFNPDTSFTKQEEQNSKSILLKTPNYKSSSFLDQCQSPMNKFSSKPTPPKNYNMYRKFEQKDQISYSTDVLLEKNSKSKEMSSPQAIDQLWKANESQKVSFIFSKLNSGFKIKGAF